MISRRNAVKSLALTAVSGVGIGARAAGRFPTHTVRIVVPYAAGTATDLSARLIAEGLSKAWGVGVVVENLAAASGINGTSVVEKLPPDGYNLLMIATNHVINPFIYRKLPYDSVRDFSPICMVAQTKIALVVNARSDIRDMKDLLDKARQQPGRLNYGSAGNGSVGNLIMEQIKQITHVSITHIPYRGQNQALADLSGGQIDVALPAIGVAAPLIKSGRLRAIGLVSKSRFPLAPDIPTVQAQIGHPVEELAWWGLIGPRGMAPDRVDAINAAVRKQLRTPLVMERMRVLYAEIVGSSPQEMERTIRNDMAEVAEIVRAAQIKIN